MRHTVGPRYMRSFYLQICIYSIEKWPFFWNLSSNLQWSLVFLYANSLYASIFLESLYLAYNEVPLYWTKRSEPPIRKTKSETISYLRSFSIQGPIIFRGRFHQHFTRAFFVQKFWLRNLLAKENLQKSARKMLMKLTPELSFLSIILLKNDSSIGNT